MAKKLKIATNQGNKYDQACRFVMFVRELPLLLWLMRLSKAKLRVVTWLPMEKIRWPGHPDRICDTVAHLRARGNSKPWLIVVEFQIEADELMFGRLLVYLGESWIQLKPDDLRGDRFNLGSVVVNPTERGSVSQRMPPLGKSGKLQHMDGRMEPQGRKFR